MAEITAVMVGSHYIKNVFEIAFNLMSMKKLCFLVIGLVAITSCSNNDFVAGEQDPIVQTVTTHLDNTPKNLPEIQQGIDSIRYQHANQVGQQKNIGKWLKKLWKHIKQVALADAVGAIKGAFGGNLGTIVSKAAENSVVSVVTILFTDDKSPNDGNGTPQEGTTPSKVRCKTSISTDSCYLKKHPTDSVVLIPGNSKEDSVGYYHNAVIAQVIHNHGDENVYFGSGEMSIPMIQEICTATEQVMNLEPGTLCKDSAMIAADLLDLEENAESDTLRTFDELCAYYKQKEPAVADLLCVIAKYVDDIDDINDYPAFKTYSENVVNLIDSAQIDDDTKSLLKEAISVAYASAKLWNENKLGDDDETNDQ